MILGVMAPEALVVADLIQEAVVKAAVAVMVIVTVEAGVGGLLMLLI